MEIEIKFLEKKVRVFNKGELIYEIEHIGNNEYFKHLILRFTTETFWKEYEKCINMSIHYSTKCHDVINDVKMHRPCN